MSVDRCVCHNVEFEDLNEIAKENNIKNLEELQELQDFGMCCQMCIPYVEKMLKTKKTSFKVFYP